MPKAAKPKPAPKLTDRQVLALNTMMEQLVLSPEVGASFLANPRPTLLQLNMTEADVVQVVDYFKYIRKLVEEDHGDDWV